MEFELRDGKGSGRRLSVNSLNRLESEAVTFDREDDAIARQQGYQISSGPVTFTSGGQASGILYFKNDEEVDCVLDRVVLMIGTNSGNVNGTVTGDWTHRIIRNPVGGTLIDNAVAAGISNSNHGSSNILNAGANIFKGVEGDTIATTSGGGAPLPVQQQSNRIVFPVGRRLPKGSSFAIQLTAPSLGGGAEVIAVSVAHVFLDSNLV